MTAPSPTLPAVRLQVLGAPVLQALIDLDLEAARRAAGVPLPADFLKDTWLWTLRLGQMIGEPQEREWLVRAVVAVDGPAGGEVVGHAGFHGAPDDRGMVEIGYRIVPAFRRRGYARAAVAELLAYARTHGVRVARASISPGNAPSLRIAALYGFTHVGEQMDEIDGLELLFEREV
ncbi:MAG TPA: GNAT family protein [Baekduia sp.]|nr:GNAT family protein [Baekduia sp.]